jgi:hypothetical protein
MDDGRLELENSQANMTGTENGRLRHEFTSLHWIRVGRRGDLPGHGTEPFDSPQNLDFQRLLRNGTARQGHTVCQVCLTDMGTTHAARDDISTQNTDAAHPASTAATTNGQGTKRLALGGA